MPEATEQSPCGWQLAPLPSPGTADRKVGNGSKTGRSSPEQAPLPSLHSTSPLTVAVLSMSTLSVVLVRSFSKFYALAGARIGYCIANRDVVADLMARKDVFNVNALGQVLARAALRRRREFSALAEEALECRTALVEYLKDLGFSVHPPSANYVLATHREQPASMIQAGLHEQGIAVRRFDGPLTGNSIRITVAPRPIVEIFADRLSQVLSVL